MTIFQKMILVPVLSLILYGSFIAYSFTEHQKSNKKNKELRDNYVPVMNILNENILLFSGIPDVFKDSVLAKEHSWLADALTLKNKLDANLVELESYPSIIDKVQLQKIKTDFNTYFVSANRLAENLLIEQDILLYESITIDKVERYVHLSRTNFEQLKLSVQNQFISTIDKTINLMNELLFWGGVMAVLSLIVLTSVTFFISLSTRNSFRSLVKRTKSLALGDTDFSERISRTQRDELGVLIHWFNRLSDKLESNYLKLETLSITDKLTQLNNRTRTDQFLPEAIVKALESQSPLVLIIIDIDHFKKVNDSFGHLVGDDVLKLFAKILKESARSGDYISRWGGEEFVLVWQNIKLEHAVNKANELKAKVQDRHFPIVGEVTASMGLTLLNKNDDMDSLIARADNHLYQAKENGRNIVFSDHCLITD